MTNESPYLRMLKNKLIPLDPSYLHELEVLRSMLRQEDYQESGWGGSWTKERYQDLSFSFETDAPSGSATSPTDQEAS